MAQTKLELQVFCKNSEFDEATGVVPEERQSIRALQVFQ